MRILFFILIIIINAFGAFGQVYSDSPNGTIPGSNLLGTNGEACFSMTVSGLNPSTLNNTFGLHAVCVDIDCDYSGDYSITLVAPDGTEVFLTDTVDASGQNYSGTCFSYSGTNFIYSGSAPFSDDYKPNSPLGQVNNGQNGNGTWQICLKDDRNHNFFGSDDAGTLLSWSIEFNSQPDPSCGSNPVADDYCNNATQITSFSGYCGNTSSSYDNYNTDGTDENGTIGSSSSSSLFCGTIENNSWLSFEAGDDTAVLSVQTYNCENDEGIQMHIYSTTDCRNFTAVSNCNSFGNTEPFTIQATDLVPGETYYLMIDGFGGDVCDYMINPVSGINISNDITASPTEICPDDSTTITASTEGRIGTITYEWYANGSFLFSDSDTAQSNTQVFSPDIQTEYMVVISDVTSGLPPDSLYIIISILPPAMCGFVDADFTYNNDQCYYGHSFDFTNTGTADYYSWSFTNGTPATSNDENPTGIIWNAPGAYAVTLTVYNDDSTLTESITKNITIYSEPTTNISVISHEHCNLSDGIAKAIVSGGSIPYQYKWHPTGQTTQTAIGLSQGAYDVYITDNNGCTDTASVMINHVAGQTVTLTYNDEFCGQCNGNATVVIDNGGTAPFSYNWENTANGQFVGNSNMVNGLCGGSYELTVTDSAGCTSVETFLVQTIPGPNDITVSVESDYCNLGLGKANLLSISGGTPDYTHVWKNGAQVMGYDSVVTGLYSGDYTILVTDDNGCEYSEVFTIDSLPGFFVNTTTVPDICGQCIGSATVNVNGGYTDYNYSWDNGVPITSAQTTNTKTELCSGAHSIRVEDNLGCVQVLTITVDEIPGPDVSIINVDDISCFGEVDGTATAQATQGGTGGSTSFAYEWDNDPTMVNATATGLSEGTHTVVVTDGNNCSNTASVIINEPDKLFAIITSSRDPLCFGESTGYVTVGSTGGTPPFTYLWNNGATSDNNAGLSSGYYSVVITDDNGCTAQDSITLTDPPVLTCSITDTIHELCENGYNASATVGAQGGTLPYSYHWVPSGQPTQTAINLTNGTYSVEVKDANGCICNSQVTITTQYAPTFSILTTNDRCDYCEGKLETTQPIGGNGGPYSYWWIDAQNDTISTMSSIEDLCAGMYRLIVTDGDCKRMKPVSVQSLGGLDVEAIASPGMVNILKPKVNFYTETIGEEADSCYWDFGDGTFAYSCDPTHSYNGEGTYDVMVVVQDEYGCLDTAYTEVVVNDIYTFYIPNSFSPNSDGINETFGPKGSNIDDHEYEIRIFNRWGEQVFYTTDPYETWNGRKYNTGNKVLPEGVYVYRILLKDYFGQSYEYSGHLNLLH